MVFGRKVEAKVLCARAVHRENRISSGGEIGGGTERTLSGEELHMLCTHPLRILLGSRFIVFGMATS